MNPIYFALLVFAIFVGFNIYIRIRALKYYQELVKNRINFTFWDVFSKSKWEAVVAKYPAHELLLLNFRKHMLVTGILFVAVIILVLILLYLMTTGIPK